jgi:hypothetical protein
VSPTRPYIIWWAIIVHVAWGIALISDPSIAPVAILVGLHWILGLGVQAPMLGGILIGAALLAMWSLVADTRLANHVSLLLLLPQYALLVAAFISDAQSVGSGVVDGNDVDRLLLLVVLCPVMIAAVLHSVAIIERHLRWTQH